LELDGRRKSPPPPDFDPELDFAVVLGCEQPEEATAAPAAMPVMDCSHERRVIPLDFDPLRAGCFTGSS